MSRCAHARSLYEIRHLPKCPQCGKEMNLVLVSYEKLKTPVYEWECQYCELFIDRSLENEVIHDEESVLHNRKRGKVDGKAENRRSFKDIMRCSFRSKSK